MQIQFKTKILSLILIIFVLPFLDFVKNNTSEIDIILGKSFYFLFIICFFLLVISSLILNFFLKKYSFYDSLLIISIFFWLLFKHNFLNLLLKKTFTKYSFINYEYSSEISLFILLTLSFYFSILILRKNIFFKRFVYIFFLLSFFTSSFQVLFTKKNLEQEDSETLNFVNFPDKINKKKENIYFFILDGMQPIRQFESYYNLDLKQFVSSVENKQYQYIHGTKNLYDNTTHGLSAIFYLNKIFSNNNKLKKETSILYPTLLRINQQSDLINNLNNLGYEFKWIGNFFAYCPKFNIKYCLNKNKNTIIDTYLYINFFRQSPLIQIVINFGYIFDFDYNKKFFFKLNDGMGRLTNYLKSENIEIKKPTFYFIHHMSPHWPYITDENCSYKSYPGEKNYEGYKSAYLCNLKKIQDTISFLDYFDPKAAVIFQSDHNWLMSKNEEDKKMIFNLFRLDNNCEIDNTINYNNVNILRLVFSCMTGNNPNYIIE